MTNFEIIEHTQNYVKTILSTAEAGHDWWHAHRVTKMAKYLADQEKADIFIVEMAALLHDVADHKFNSDNTALNSLSEFLHACITDENTITSILDIIERISFKGANAKIESLTLEAQIVQDADRLDALGAIGIARTFSYGGYKNRPFYDPSIEPMLHDNFEAYKNHQGTTINHFYEKLFLLKDKLNTPTARQIAEERHQFMKLFLNQFKQEWEFASIS